MYVLAKQRGLTLLELLASLTILGICSSIAISSWQNTIRQARSNEIAGELMQLVNYARQEAVYKNHTITLCGSSDGEHCNGRWLEHILVFMDQDADGVRDPEDALLQDAQLPAHTTGSLSWRSFRNKSYLQLQASGTTYFQNGHFTYCPADGKLRFARHLILNVSGYLRMAIDRNGDGIVETANGEALRC